MPGQNIGTLWLRAASPRPVVAAHLRNVAGTFKAAGWSVVTGTPRPTKGPLAVLNDPWADPLPATASFLARRGRGGKAVWHIPRTNGAPGKQDWPLVNGPYTTMDYEKRAAASQVRPGRARALDPGAWLGFAVAAADHAESLLAIGWPPTPVNALLDPGAVVYRYTDPAGHERHELDPFIPPHTRTFVDVGCGHGKLGERHRGPGRWVIGIEPDRTLARSAAGRLDLVLPLDAVQGLGSLRGPLDCIVFADVLEHLNDPEGALQAAAGKLRPEGRIIVSLPNSAWAPILFATAAGRWDPTLAGVQARDHFIPMTPSSFASMAARSGLNVERQVSFEAPLPRRLRWWARVAAWTAGGRFSDLSAPQWVMCLKLSRQVP